MSSFGLGEMTEGDFADTCAEKNSAQVDGGPIDVRGNSTSVALFSFCFPFYNPLNRSDQININHPINW